MDDLWWKIHLSIEDHWQFDTLLNMEINVVDFPIRNGDFSWLCKRLPEGSKSVIVRFIHIFSGRFEILLLLRLLREIPSILRHLCCQLLVPSGNQTSRSRISTWFHHPNAEKHRAHHDNMLRVCLTGSISGAGDRLRGGPWHLRSEIWDMSCRCICICHTHKHTHTIIGIYKQISILNKCQWISNECRWRTEYANKWIDRWTIYILYLSYIYQKPVKIASAQIFIDLPSLANLSLQNNVLRQSPQKSCSTAGFEWDSNY